MTLTILDVEQGTPEWHDARRGMITASVIGRLITEERPDALEVACPDCGAEAGLPCVGKRKPHAPIASIHGPRTAAVAERPTRLVVADNDTSRGLALTLAAERVSGFTEDTPMTGDMFRGVMAEPFARDAYSGTYAKADEIGFMVEDKWGFEIGASPDGLVGDDGGIEVKAPRAKTHVATILADEVPAHYMAQVQTCLLVSGREWWDWISYVGGMPLYVKRVLPDPDWQAVILAAAKTFEANVAEIVADYRKRVEGLPATERIDYNALGLEF